MPRRTEDYTFETEGSDEVIESIAETGASTESSTISAEIPVIYSFYIDIPKIGLKKDITSNVDPSDKEEYLDTIERSIAHGMYTALPYVQGGNTYLFAHSKLSENGQTPEGGWFTRIDELTTGDTVTLYLNDNQYTYTVKNRIIVDPLDTSVYTGESMFDGHNSLTLQTCWPRGTTEKRLIVQAISD
ncbi:MAG: class E sortase [bacterium]